MRTILGLLLALTGLSLGVDLPMAHAADYEIGTGDVLKLVVVGQADLTANFTVDAEGMVNLPILGKIKAAEHTPQDLERKLTTLLADGYLKRPQVTVSITEFGSQKVFVTGEVLKPGQYALKADRTLLVLLGDIGPLSPNVGHEVLIVRPPAQGSAAAAGGNPPVIGTPAAGTTGAPGPLGPEFPAEAGATDGAAQPQPGAAAATPALAIPGLPFVSPGAEVFRISLLELQSGNPEKNITLHAGDTVYFPKASQVYVMGSVARPGPYRYQEGMTVLQALTQAGGATERGSAGRTKLVRIVGGKKLEHKVKATDLVEPEDTLIVPERFF